MMALWARDIPIAKLLLQHNADVNVVLSDGITVLSIVALDDKYLPFAKELLKHKADVNHREENGNTPLKIATQNKAWGMVKLLKEAGAKQ
jgi:ankyrin repeat protein